MASDDQRTRPNGAGWNHRTEVMARPPATPAPAASAFDPAADRLALGAELGRGGMGRVVRATDAALGRSVAVKVALTDDAGTLARFEREVRITARLAHPAIIPIYDVGRDAAGRPFYVMREIAGEPLADRVARATDLRGRLALLPNVLAAVDAAAFAHARGVIHRDIKPWNILVGTYGETLLIDWGLARELDAPEAAPPSEPAAGPAGAPALTVVGLAYGTPGYMAPEQARGQSGDARADVYALGATLMHVVLGRGLIAVDAGSGWIARMAVGAPPPLPALPPEIPGELRAIIAKAMAPAAADRYADAGEVAVELRRFLGGQLVAAHRYTLTERAGRFVRVHRFAVALVALAVVGAVAAVVVAGARGRAVAGEQLADERGARLLLDRASELAPRDPTRAVAVLAQLPAGSPAWRRARDIAAIAAANGIAHGVAAHTGGVNAIVLAPDGTRAASGGDDGVVAIHDLATAATRTLATGAPVEELVWTADGTALVIARRAGGVSIADVATGTERVLAADVRASGLWQAGARVRFVDLIAHTLAEVPLVAGAPVVVLAQGVSGAAGRGDRTVVTGSGGPRILDGATVRALAGAPDATTDILGTELSPDGKRAAVSTFDGVTEWDADTGAVRARWPLGGKVFYAPDHLYVATVARAVTQLAELDPNGNTRELAHGAWSGVAFGLSANGAVFAGSDGTLVVLTALGARPVAHESSGRVAVGAAPGSSVFALGTTNGAVQWWAGDIVAPRSIPTEHHGLCGVAGDLVYTLDLMEGVYATHRVTGAERTVTARPAMQCEIVPGGRSLMLEVAGEHQVGVVSAASGETTELQGALFATAADDGGVVIATATAVQELAPGAPGLASRWPITGTVLGLDAHGGRIAVALAHGDFVRIAEDGAIARGHVPGNIDFMSLEPSGAIWVSDGTGLYRWDGQLAAVAVPAAIEAMFGHAGGVAIRTTDHIWYDATAAGVAARSDAEPRLALQHSGRVVARYGDGEVRETFVDTGETLRRRFQSSGFEIAFGNAERSMVMLDAGGLTVFEDPVPADPAAVRAWIATATNAVLVPGRDDLSWR